jgi:uncharacterized protein YbaP (TraB family)
MTRSSRAAALCLALWAACASARTPSDASTEPPAAPVAASAAPSCPPEAEPVTADEAVAGLRDATDNGFLWKATKDGRTSYLYGTIHIAQRAWMFPGPHVLAALRASDLVALELDPTDPDIVARLQRALARKPGAPELAAPLAARLRAQMAAACIEPASLSGARPEMRAVTVEVMAGRRLGLQPSYGVDIFLAGVAQGLKKPIRSLETPESQAALLVSDDPAETARAVGAILEELEGGKGPLILGRLAGDWRRGDLADLGRYGDWCDCLNTPAQRADFVKLIDDRNPLMADKIVQWHGEGRSLFVAVGSLHMIGDIGLPQLLKARGFDVERVAFDEAH